VIAVEAAPITDHPTPSEPARYAGHPPESDPILKNICAVGGGLVCLGVLSRRPLVVSVTGKLIPGDSPVLRTLIVASCQFYCVWMFVPFGIDGELVRVVLVRSKAVIYRRPQDGGPTGIVFLGQSVDGVGPVLGNLDGYSLHAPVSWTERG